MKKVNTPPASLISPAPSACCAPQVTVSAAPTDIYVGDQTMFLAYALWKSAVVQLDEGEFLSSQAIATPPTRWLVRNFCIALMGTTAWNILSFGISSADPSGSK
jgi:hypothetical protein